jgi:hypothetical protein
MSEMQNNELSTALLVDLPQTNGDLCELLLKLWPSLCALRQVLGLRGNLNADDAFFAGQILHSHIGLMDAIQRYAEVHGHGYQSIFAHEKWKKNG